MRFTALIGFVAAALTLTMAPAQAQWKSYLSRDLQFTFATPGAVKVEKGVYKTERSGDHPAIFFRSAADGIEYTATVVDMGGANPASLLEEAVVTFQGRNKVLMDNYGRIGALYGRKGTLELPNNGGRSMASFYVNNGRLYEMRATITPANGDYGSPDAARFVDSEVLNLGNVEPGATELKLPN